MAKKDFRPCVVCTRTINDPEENCCDECVDFFLDYLNSEDRYVCIGNHHCLDVPSVEGLKCQECRLDACKKAGVKIPECMNDQLTTGYCLSQNFIDYIVDEVAKMTKPISQQ